MDRSVENLLGTLTIFQNKLMENGCLDDTLMELIFRGVQDLKLIQSNLDKLPKPKR